MTRASTHSGLAIDVTAAMRRRTSSSGTTPAMSRNPQPRRPVRCAAPDIVWDALDSPRPPAPRMPESIAHGPSGR
ncbi:hypothetical protein [Actinomadura madurae]|uniref:hypothetical protein n=1 Tax=Actinomadura madurae TaxID=1993 RepID=UPI0020D20D13|nr:hypothetical protein [Actinomadura madurae]MCP9979446.1 hypothetical protein [Actinomadura madurae]